ncbi:MAG TPA: hypothetical protein VEB64_18900 [Azospirillaceae bacterium]|nr:hypothetical protein [Azospirillaceae bacterium]
MPYFPAIELTPQMNLLLARGALRLQPGQWVKGGKGYGRYLRTDPRTGTIYVSWVRPGDDWRTQAQRFHRACVKGFVGKYRPLYDRIRAARSGAVADVETAGGLRSTERTTR